MFKELITYLQSEIKTVLDPIIRPEMKVALLDYPYHSNVGDSLIWLGEIEYLKYRHCKICYSSYIAMHNFETQLLALEEVDVILLHGGGNLGTLWPQFQRFREAIIQRFPHKQIVQFPQSVFFDNDFDLKSTLDLFAGHEKLTILARDRVSYEILKSCSDINVKLCPDMAFMLGHINISGQQSEKQVVYLSRNDKEKLNVHIDIKLFLDQQHTAITTDWLDESLAEKILIKFERKLLKLLNQVRREAKPSLLMLNAIAEVRKTRGIRILSRGQMVMTDRLHAHILSVLIDKPNFIFDNNNNKLSAFYNTWMFDTSGVHFFDAGSVITADISSLINSYSSIDTRHKNEAH